VVKLHPGLRACYPLAAALRGGMAGRVEGEQEATAPFSQDYSRQAGAPPALVVHPDGEADLIHVLRTARAAGVPVSVRGAGHSCSGRTLCPGGIVISNRSDEPHFVLREDGLVEVETRTTWRALEEGLAARGRTSPVLIDYPSVTVGGGASC
jgi:FAD/FMN-containing dehydrogenase